MARLYVLSQDCLLCLLTQSEEHGEDTRPGYGLLHKESWRWLLNSINPAAKAASAPLFMEEHCQSPAKLPPATYLCSSESEFMSMPRGPLVDRYG